MIIKKIIDTFRDLSREHKLVRSFEYNRVSKTMGSGEQIYPRVLLEDPIYVGDAKVMDGTVLVTVSFDITCLPHAFSNFNVKQLTEEECENVCHEIALNYVARLRELNKDFETRNGLEILKYSFVTLRNWSDDKASGVRCTMKIEVDNDIQLCDTDEHFDPSKEFDLNSLLNDINTDDAQGCSEVYDYKLPKFKID